MLFLSGMKRVNNWYLQPAASQNGSSQPEVVYAPMSTTMDTWVEARDVAYCPAGEKHCKDFPLQKSNGIEVERPCNQRGTESEWGRGTHD